MGYFHSESFELAFCAVFEKVDTGTEEGDSVLEIASFGPWMVSKHFERHLKFILFASLVA
jgi:hypothetical protein